MSKFEFTYEGLLKNVLPCAEKPKRNSLKDVINPQYSDVLREEIHEMLLRMEKMEFDKDPESRGFYRKALTQILQGLVVAAKELEISKRKQFQAFEMPTFMERLLELSRADHELNSTIYEGSTLVNGLLSAEGRTFDMRHIPYFAEWSSDDIKTCRIMMAPSLKHVFVIRAKYYEEETYNQLVKRGEMGHDAKRWCSYPAGPVKRYVITTFPFDVILDELLFERVLIAQFSDFVDVMEDDADDALRDRVSTAIRNFSKYDLVH